MKVHPLAGSQLVNGQAEMLRSRKLPETGAAVVLLYGQLGGLDVRDATSL